MKSPTLNRPCTIIRRSASGTANAYGDKIRAEQSVATFWELQQRGRSEGEDEVSDTRALGVFGPDEALHSGDAIVDGLTSETYEVEGEPARWRNRRTQREEHVEATVRRTSGPADEVGS